MLKNKAEYQSMFEVEERLWWYQILHKKVMAQIKSRFKNDCTINILDAGCGTGGLLLKLKKAGYINSQGIDFNRDAILFSEERGVQVKKANITQLHHVFPASPMFDIIICNDVLYQFENHDIAKILHHFVILLKPNGIIISNNQAFNIFTGIHDIAVGAKQRFVLADFKNQVKDLPLEIKYGSYWSFFLSPLILAVRLLQRFKLFVNWTTSEEASSDVAMPPNALNNLFYTVANYENSFFKSYPFGSSLFLVFQKS
jgi:SAM-dependent methyltransferase